jgi:hypothetical protein
MTKPGVPNLVGIASATSHPTSQTFPRVASAKFFEIPVSGHRFPPLSTTKTPSFSLYPATCRPLGDSTPSPPCNGHLFLPPCCLYPAGVPVPLIRARAANGSVWQWRPSPYRRLGLGNRWLCIGIPVTAGRIPLRPATGIRVTSARARLRCGRGHWIMAANTS